MECADGALQTRREGGPILTYLVVLAESLGVFMTGAGPVGGGRAHQVIRSTFRRETEISFKYRVIHKSLRDFRTRLRNNQDRHGRKEHINR